MNDNYNRKAWTVSVICHPVSKKRERIVSPTVKFKQDSYFETMIGDAFKRAYPDHKPFGYENYDYITKLSKKTGKEYQAYILKKNADQMKYRIQLYSLVYLKNGNPGDSDNYTKAICDGLNKILYVDDRQVVAPITYVIINPDEEERIDIYAEEYIEDWDKTLIGLKLDFLRTTPDKRISIENEYYTQKMSDFTKKQLINKICKRTKKNSCINYYIENGLGRCKLYENPKKPIKKEIIECKYNILNPNNQK